MVISMIAIGMLMSVYDESIRQQKIANITPEDRRNDLRMVNARGSNSEKYTLMNAKQRFLVLMSLILLLAFLIILRLFWSRR